MLVRPEHKSAPLTTPSWWLRGFFVIQAILVAVRLLKVSNWRQLRNQWRGDFRPAQQVGKAAGTFNHKSTNGDLLETGVWTAGALISFDSYGIAPARSCRGPAFGGPQIGHKRLPMRSRPLPTGGLAIFRILLMPVSGTTKTAVLQVNCALGDVPANDR